MREFSILLPGMAIFMTVFVVSCQKVPAPKPAEAAPAQPVTAPAVAAAAAAGPPEPEVRKAAPVETSPVKASPVIEAEMSSEFLTAFNDSKGCRGIVISAEGAKTSRDFRIMTTFGHADTPEMEEQWMWSLFDTRHDAEGEFRAAGNADSAADAMRDVCMEIWQSF